MASDQMVGVTDLAIEARRKRSERVKLKVVPKAQSNQNV